LGAFSVCKVGPGLLVSDSHLLQVCDVVFKIVGLGSIDVDVLLALGQRHIHPVGVKLVGLLVVVSFVAISPILTHFYEI
jgi:hypothetical protein